MIDANTSLRIGVFILSVSLTVIVLPLTLKVFTTEKLLKIRKICVLNISKMTYRLT